MEHDPVPDGEAGPDDPADADALRSYAGALAEGVHATLAGWVVRCVEERAGQAGVALTADLLEAARRAGEEARTEVGPAVRALLARDVDDQPTGPLDLVRGAVRYPTAVLAQAGVPAVTRDEVDQRLHPDDIYDLSPASFRDLSPDLHEPGIAWGAAKAHVVLARRRREGRR